MWLPPPERIHEEGSSMDGNATGLYKLYNEFEFEKNESTSYNFI